MIDKAQQNSANALYEEGMSYNWRQDKSPANSALSRANLERAAALGHTKALREVAEMIFIGSGGPQNQEQALRLKWGAFKQGDNDALEELSAMLESYAESSTEPNDRRRAENAAQKAEAASELLRWLESYLYELVRLKNTES